MDLHVIKFPFNILKEIFWWFVENHSSLSSRHYLYWGYFKILCNYSDEREWHHLVINIFHSTSSASISIHTSIRNVVWDALECQDLIKCLTLYYLVRVLIWRPIFLCVFIIMVFFLWNKNYLNPFLNLSLKLQNRPN